MEHRDRRSEILNVFFDDVTVQEAVCRSLAMLETDGYHYCVGTNANLLCIAHDNAGYRDAINQADLSLADGCGVLAAAHILGRALCERVACIDFLNALFPVIRFSRVYILGGKPGVAACAGKKLEKQYPNLMVCGTHHGFFPDDETMAMEIAKKQPDLLLVCLGSPKQELWMARYGPLTGAKLAIGCGGWIDIAAGDLERAPLWWREHNLEWAWRLIHEPWRIGRVCRSLTVPMVAIGELVSSAVHGRRSNAECLGEKVSAKKQV